MERSERKFLDRWAPRICALCLLAPVGVLLGSTYFEGARLWLDEDHPMRALLVVSLVLAISWASHSLGLGVAHPRFWASCMVVCALLFVTLAVAEGFGFVFLGWGREFAKLAILMSCPVVLLIARWLRGRDANED